MLKVSVQTPSKPKWNTSTKSKPSNKLPSTLDLNMGREIQSATPIPYQHMKHTNSQSSLRSRTSSATMNGNLTRQTTWISNTKSFQIPNDSRYATIAKKTLTNAPIPQSGVAVEPKSTISFKKQSKIIGNTFEAFTNLLSSKCESDKDLRLALKELRILVLKRGIPTNIPATPKFTSEESTLNLRSKVWKSLLSVTKTPHEVYIALLHQGETNYHSKILNDAFRTCKTDEKFTRRVSTPKIIRILSAFTRRASQQEPHQPSKFALASRSKSHLCFSYVQGMNVLAAPFAYTMTECDAFFTFVQFITTRIPLYVQPSLDGVHMGVHVISLLILAS